jgi:hypothetical protein
VTPELAHEWLGVNFSNRHLEKDDVQRYARDMEAGNWRLTGEAIKFSWEGNLRDGQHRLHAVIRSGAKVPMLVVRGLDPKAQFNMDSGRKRTVANALTMKGERWATNMAALASMILKDFYGTRKPTVDEQLNLFDADPSIRVIVQEIVPNLPLPKRMMSKTWLGYLYWRLERVDSSDAAKFFDSLSRLENLPQGSPILALHRRLLSRGSGHGYSDRQEVIAVTFTAWNAWRAGQTRRTIALSYGVGGAIFVPDPI